MTRWNVDDEVVDSPLGYGLQVFADGIDVDPRDEFSARFQDGPPLDYEFLKVAAGVLRLQPN